MVLDKRLGATCAALIFALSIAFYLATAPQSEGTVPIHENILDAEITTGDTTSLPEYKYLLKEHEGKLAVFMAGKEDSEPAIKFDINTKYLPDYDQALLKEGIKVNTDADLNALIEDYTS